MFENLPPRSEPGFHRKADDCQVLFLGACLDPGAPVMFVTEYMPKGARGGWDGRSNPG